MIPKDTMSYGATEYKRPKHFSEICSECGCTYGAHLGDAYDSDFYGRSFPKGYCPGTEGRMDWDKVPGTTFKPSGKHKGDDN
jgi:hypothetical protein